MTSETNPVAAGVLELRQYTLHPGRRETLIELFEREFVHTQEALGIALPGLFRDLDDDDRFVWLRGFPDMSTRAKALAAFDGVHAPAGCAGQLPSTMRTAVGGELTVQYEQVLRLSPTARSQLPAHTGEC
ncbi:MAG: NIPSNAP family protein [Metallibacterium scheffleri]|uniref:NIPSNAP family protein n=1 Tax=Metallibacterium scheffleri TaxID=993689 RepID=UPI0026EBF754|nr:NIPSNAP family protein [Metallibacterium scheffleri]MCK9368342.1 NIPSNAP family protein [Metallibacterium scheffleri]